MQHGQATNWRRKGHRNLRAPAHVAGIGARGRNTRKWQEYVMACVLSMKVGDIDLSFSAAGAAKTWLGKSSLIGMSVQKS